MISATLSHYLTAMATGAASTKYARQYKANKAATDPAWTILETAKNNARIRGLDCNLTVEYLRPLVNPRRCNVTGYAVTFGGTSRGPFTASIDRIDNSKGYVIGNVQIVCWMYNTMKSSWSHEDCLKVAHALVVLA